MMKSLYEKPNLICRYGVVALFLLTLPALLLAQPFGYLDCPSVTRPDCPVNGLAGAINVTGWALSQNTVVRVAIYRNAVSGESGLIYVQDAPLIAGARPDIPPNCPSCPRNDWGWGTLVLSNQLRDSNGDGGHGNGTYTLHIFAYDSLNYSTDFAQVTITVDNAHSHKPFGTIDTPTAGGLATGTNYVNFGWALTPQPNMIPTDGSTIDVIVDGQMVGHPNYNLSRCDVGSIFPNLMNSGSANCALNGQPPGPVGYYRLDTTILNPDPVNNGYHNGLHTISWNVYDDAGNFEGLGSRYFSAAPFVSLTNTSNSEVAPDYIATDSYLLSITAGASRANQPVSVTTTLDGANQGSTSMGTTDTSGNFTLTATKNVAGSWTEQWYVGGVAAVPTLRYNVADAPMGYNESTSFPSVPNSFTAPARFITCNDISGIWIEHDTNSPQNSVKWTLQQQPDNSLSGTLSFFQIDNPNTPSECNGGQVDYPVTGNSNGTSSAVFHLSATNPSVSMDACGVPVPSSFSNVVTLSGASCSAGHGNISSTGGGSSITALSSSQNGSIAEVEATTASLSLNARRDFKPKQIQGGTTWASTTPRFSVSYSAYIPVDHLPGPTTCNYTSHLITHPFIDKLYLGDKSRGTYRATQSMFLVPDFQVAKNFFAGTGETRSYGYGSGVGGSDIFGTLSGGGQWLGVDEDNIPGDCYLWHLSGIGATTDMQGNGVSYPTNAKVQLNLYGSTSNPLESAAAKIRWNMTVVVDDSNPTQPMAQVFYTHSCYPAHIVKVNGMMVYEYQPTRNDTAYLRYCLLNSFTQMSGQSLVKQVPAR